MVQEKHQADAFQLDARVWWLRDGTSSARTHHPWTAQLHFQHRHLLLLMYQILNAATIFSLQHHKSHLSNTFENDTWTVSNSDISGITTVLKAVLSMVCLWFPSTKLHSFHRKQREKARDVRGGKPGSIPGPRDTRHLPINKNHASMMTNKWYKLIGKYKLKQILSHSLVFGAMTRTFILIFDSTLIQENKAIIQQKLHP